MQAIKSRKLIGGFIALALMLAIGFFAAQSVYAETDQQPAAQSESAAAYDAAAASNPPAAPQYPRWDGSYYYDSTGKRVTGFQTIGGKFYYFDSSGKKQVNLYKFYQSKLYRFDGSGTGKVYSGIYNKKYYKSGVPGTGTYKGIYYKKGTPLNGFAKKKLYKKGKLYSGVKDGYYYRKGVKQTKYKSTVKKMDNGKIYYFQKNKKVFKGTGWKRYKGKRYYFKKGTALTGWKYVGKYKYYFDKQGKLCQDLIAKFGNKWKKKNIMIIISSIRSCTVGLTTAPSALRHITTSEKPRPTAASVSRPPMPRSSMTLPGTGRQKLSSMTASPQDLLTNRK